MIRASRITDDEWKRDLLLHYAGPSMQILFASLPELPNHSLRGPLINVEHYTPNMTVYEEAINKLNNFFLPKSNLTYERHMFREMKQNSGESIDGFTVRLRIQATRCGFGDGVDENIKDQIIQNCQSSVLRRDLLKRGDADLAAILRVAKIFETVAHQEKRFNSTAIPEQKPIAEHVNKINSTSISGNRRERSKPFYRNRNRTDNIGRTCFRCGYDGHGMDDPNCPARGKTCNKCGGRDHFYKRCRSRLPSEGPGNKTNRNSTKDTKTDDFKNTETVKQIVTNEEYIFNVTITDDNNEIQCKIGGVAVTAIIDSGSKYNLMGRNVWEMLKSHKILVSNQQNNISTVFKAYGGQELTMLGAFSSDIQLRGQHKIVEFYVINGDGRILIGRDTATQMGILNLNTSVNDVDIVATKTPLGTIKDVIIDIPIKPDAKPIIQPYRKIPSINQPMEIDEETADMDRQNKERGKQYTDSRRHAKEIDIGKGDTVLVKRMVKLNKLSSNFEPKEYKVITRKGGEVEIESTTSGKRYRRNVSHLKKINVATPEITDQHSSTHNTDQFQQPNAEQNKLAPEKHDPLIIRQNRQIQRPAHFKDFVLQD